MPVQPVSADVAQVPERLAILVYGPYGGGKTHLQGDFLRWCQAQKGEGAFVNLRSEDGADSIGGMGLGQIKYNATSVTDYEAIIASLRTKKLLGLAVDSLSGFYEMMLLDKFGKLRYPSAKQDGQLAQAHWGDLNMGIKNAVLQAKETAKYSLWVAAHDMSEDAIQGGKGVTPNLPGKLAQECAGRFDFVGRMLVTPLGPDKVQRKVTFTLGVGQLTRQRCPNPITEPVLIPEGGGGWANILSAIESAFKPKETKK
jgi:AAA domain-containing protein